MMKSILESLKIINYTQASCSLEVFKTDTIRFVEHPPLQSVITSSSAEAIAGSICRLNRPIIELSSGPGAVTAALLKAGAKRVISLDYNPECIQLTQRIQRSCPEHLDVIWAHRRKSADGRAVLAGLYTNIRESVCPERLGGLGRGWGEESAGVLLGACQDDYSTQQLLSQYLAALLLRASFFQLGRVEYFVLHNQFHLRKVLARPGTNKYSRFAVLANILCDVSVKSLRIPSWHLYPAIKTKIRQTGEFLNVLHLVPKPSNPLNASNRFIDEFLRSCFQKRNCLFKDLIKELYPNYTPDLSTRILMSQPQHLSPGQYMEIINSLHRTISIPAESEPL